MVLEGVEPDLVPVGVVQLGQDPADASPAHAALFRRVVDVVIVDDTEPVDVLDREEDNS